METVTQVVSWFRSFLTYFVGELFNAGWFFAALIGFPVLRYLFKKFLKSF